MTLEQLSEKMMDDWKAGVYTKAYNDYDALLSGSEMKNIFIEKAKTKVNQATLCIMPIILKKRLKKV